MSRIKYTVLCNLYLLNSRYRRIHKNPMHIAYLSLDILHLTCVEKTPSSFMCIWKSRRLQTSVNISCQSYHNLHYLNVKNCLLFIGNGDVSNIREKFSSGTKKPNKQTKQSLLRDILICSNPMSFLYPFDCVYYYSY